MDSRKKWNSDDEGPLFPEGWAPKAKPVDSDDEVPLFSEGWAPKTKRVELTMLCLGATISLGLGAEGNPRS